jgi:hypothetical protein
MLNSNDQASGSTAQPSPVDRPLLTADGKFVRRLRPALAMRAGTHTKLILVAKYYLPHVTEAYGAVMEYMYEWRECARLCRLAYVLFLVSSGRASREMCKMHGDTPLVPLVNVHGNHIDARTPALHVSNGQDGRQMWQRVLVRAHHALLVCLRSCMRPSTSTPTRWCTC